MQPDCRQLETSEPLPVLLTRVAEDCRACGICVKHCAFLTSYGNPRELAQRYQTTQPDSSAFACSLCNLCTSLCPFGVDPARMFLAMRRMRTVENGGIARAYSVLRSYERRGLSPRFSSYGLPNGCDTVFFPGCALPGTRPDTTIKLFEHLRHRTPELGIVLDCCTKPSHDLGDQVFFAAMFDNLKRFLLDHDISKVIVACPNCYKVFRRYGTPLIVTSAYEELDWDFQVTAIAGEGTVTIHDPCAVRAEVTIHDAVRSLLGKTGLSIAEMPHTRETTICCGEGGAVGFCQPELARKWGSTRQDEAQGRTIITYCAGCTSFLNRLTPTSHLLDLLFEPEKALAGKARVSRSPFTYLNRLRVKKYFQKNLTVKTSGQRSTVKPPPAMKKKTFAKPLALLAALVAVIVAVHATGLHAYFDQDRLRELIQGYGPLGPIVFIALYSVAPSLFLPGLPFTVVAGVLFGPFWGVVYAITGATAGATLAFLIGRYTGRQWLLGRLTSPKWQQLDRDVERLGWKMVAFTRLIPLLPFNLLNYAFGLTRVRLLPYILASFIFMLPGCIAYILLSSSLFDLLRGSVSPVFIIGLLAMAALSALPFLYKRYRQRRSR
ncbi:MAG: VTT domain-containing protein [Desulfopila sp.]